MSAVISPTRLEASQRGEHQYLALLTFFGWVFPPLSRFGAAPSSEHVLHVHDAAPAPGHHPPFLPASEPLRSARGAGAACTHARLPLALTEDSSVFISQSQLGKHAF